MSYNLRESRDIRQALLKTIYGTEAPGYNVMYGGGTFDSYADHPRQAVPITTGPNAGKYSTAAGKPQFLAGTWDELQRELNLPDFSPHSQDRGAWHLAAKTYNLNTGRDLERVLETGNPNDIAQVGQTLSGKWTSLPGGIEQATDENRFVTAFNNARGNTETQMPQTQLASADSFEVVPPPGSDDAFEVVAPPSPNRVADIGKGFLGGLGRGAIELTGAIGNTQQMMGDAAGGIANWFGASPGTQQMVSGIGQKMALPGMMHQMPRSEQVQAVTGTPYEAQTTAGKYAGTAGEFVPALLSKGGPVRKAASWLIPSATSETAGLLTEGTAAEPAARLGGALLGGVAAGGRKGTALKEMRENAPSLETRGQQTNAAYKRLREAGIIFDDNAYKSFAMKLQRQLYTHGWRPNDASPITRDVKEIMERIGKPNSFDEVDSLRKGVGNLPKGSSDTDMARASIVRRAIDEFIDSGQLTSTKGLDPAIVGTMAKQARELARMNILGKKIERMKDKSEWYLAGEESGLRNQVASFGKQEGRGLTDAEKNAFKKVTRREGALNLLNITGSRIGNSIMAGAGLLGGVATGGVIPALLATGAAMGGHLAVRKGTEAYTKKAVEKALKTVLAGRPAQNKAMASDGLLRNDVNTRRLLAGSMGLLGSN